jgi:hypothetical protein
MSPSNPDVLYYGGNVLFRTADRGETWTVISPDLTTNDPGKQKPSGGPISNDNTRAEFHCTIISIAESPRDPGVIWVGTDDGNVQITRDGGKSWANVAPNIQGAPKFSWVSSISASSADAGTAYLTIDQHRLDDFAPYVFVTNDYGRSWRAIGKGLRGYAHIVLEDPKSPGLIYAGTELGIFASFDRGASWTDLRLGLPPLAVVDMKVHPRDNDLVIATHARGFYILDDVTPLQEIARTPGARGFSRASATTDSSPGSTTLFKPMPAVRYIPASDTSVLGNRVWVARNQPYGALISYYLPAAVQGGVRFTVTDASGGTVQTFGGPGAAGVNRAVWNLSEASSCAAAPAQPEGGRGRGGRGGRGDGTWVRAIPGQYTVRLTAAGQTLEQRVIVRSDPRVKATEEDMRVWHQEARKIERIDCSLDRAVAELSAIERQLADAEARATDAPSTQQIDGIRRELRPIHLALRGDPRDPGHVNLPGRINWLIIQVGNNSGRPTVAQMEWIARYGEQADQVIASLEAVKRGSLAKLTAPGISRSVGR